MSERVGLANRIGGVVATLGIDAYNLLLKNLRRRLADLRTGLDEPILPHARAKTERLVGRLELVLDQIAALQIGRDAVAEKPASDDPELYGLRGIGVQGATILVREPSHRVTPANFGSSIDNVSNFNTRPQMRTVSTANLHIIHTLEITFKAIEGRVYWQSRILLKYWSKLT